MSCTHKICRDVRFDPKATEFPRCSEMTRCARTGLAAPAGYSAAAASTVTMGHIDITRPNWDD
jgi:hypothetical protein